MGMNIMIYITLKQSKNGVARVLSTTDNVKQTPKMNKDDYSNKKNICIIMNVM